MCSLVFILMHFQIFTLTFRTTHCKLHIPAHSFGHIITLLSTLTWTPSSRTIPVHTITHFHTLFDLPQTSTFSLSQPSMDTPSHCYIYHMVHIVTYAVFIVTNMYFTSMFHNACIIYIAIVSSHRYIHVLTQVV